MGQTEMTPFDFLNAINVTKKDLFADPQAKKDYRKSAWVVNKGLSQFPDTVLYANEMNRCYYVPEEWQFLFYLNSIPKRKRYSEWAKKDKKTDSIAMVMEYYGYSSEKAKQAINLLSDEQLTMIEEKLYKGGK